MQRKPLAVLFDMDGVLVNSEPVITQAAVEGLREYGISPRHEDFLPFTGMGEDKFIGGVAQKYGLTYHPQMKKRVYEIYLRLVASKLQTYPWTLPLLGALNAQNRPFALASSADLIKVKANLTTAGIPLHYFSAIVTGEDVQNKKPAPDIYLLAAKRIAYEPHNCIVAEDALSGIRAAKNAGMRCIALPTSFPADVLLAHGADAVCSSEQEILKQIELFDKN